MVKAPDRAEVALGNPSFVWRFGQDRRLNLIRHYAPLEGARILDIGCGLGVYVRKFREFSDRVCGIDVDPKRLRDGARTTPGLMLAVGEHLPFRQDAFDLVVLNEVIEHVRDDAATLREAMRILRPGGHAVVYAPNRLYPFETHGIYLGRRFVFGNIPFVNWLPTPLRDRLVPHARAYTKGGIRRTYAGLGAEVRAETYVFPGFDNIIARRRRLGAFLRAVLYRAERTPLRVFGLSHFVVLRKPQPARAAQAGG
ncbi:MAG TPA: methyltransferase domain-containing protein [Dehalococcoidia bacterium]|nr:methyltransferase domain-containing protein [Dehalococcoidia bacterium]